MIPPAQDEVRRALLGGVRRLLAAVEQRLETLGVDDSLRPALVAAREQLDEGFLLVLVGEFNAGKSAFINALLGRALLEEGVTPTTSRISLLRFGETESSHLGADGVLTLTAPLPPLRGITLVDTPGTNAVLREHEALTRDFVPRADLVVFVGSADRPYSETERALLVALREWGKKVVIVLNKVDLLETEAQLARVVGFVREQAARTLGSEPELFALSARRALRARQAADAAAFAASGLPAFEARVTARLDEAERFRLKLLNPAGVARRVLDQAGALVAARLALLVEDVATIEAVEALLGGHADALDRDFGLRLSDVERVLLDFEKRGNAFFDARLRLGRFRELFDRERLRADFEGAVVASLPREVEQRVEGLVDWMVSEDLALWQEVMRQLRARQAAHAERLEAAVDDRFRYARQERLAAVGAQAQQAILGYDGAAEARRLAERVREAVAGTAVLQVSALGLGALVAALASTTAADVSGFLAAGTLALLGLLVLPARRQQARRELARKVASLREQLLAALRASFERERGRSLARVREVTAPYEAFVRAERGRLEEAYGSLLALGREVDALVEQVRGFGR